MERKSVQQVYEIISFRVTINLRLLGCFHVRLLGGSLDL